jgi:hypothetical protein
MQLYRAFLGTGAVVRVGDIHDQLPYAVGQSRVAHRASVVFRPHLRPGVIACELSQPVSRPSRCSSPDGDLVSQEAAYRCAA